tara:strand:+ start:8078 stop:9223 length:1146 start_codon:yes stop_codon:yes gene_type:complete
MWGEAIQGAIELGGAAIASKAAGGPGAVPSAPSYDAELDGLADAANMNKQFAEEQRAYAKNLDSELKTLGNQILDVQLPAMEEMYQWANEDRQQHADIYRPLEAEFAKQAAEYAGPGEIQRQRAQAGQDIGQSFEQQREQRQRELREAGVVGADPTQAGSRMEGLVANLEEAKAQAAGQNFAAEQTRREGRDLMGQASQMGNYLNNSASANANTAANIGNVALSGQQQSGALGLEGQRGAEGYLGGMSEAWQGSADVRDTQFQNQMDSYAAQQTQAESGAGGMGSMIGGMVGMMGGPLGSMAGSAIGGMIDKKAAGADGGQVNAPGNSTSDSGLMALSDGEYILPAKVVNNMGASMLDKFVEKQTGAKPTHKQALPIPGGM